MESLKQWYLKFIDSFREEYEKLSEDEKKDIGSQNDFSNPCQIEVFWIAEWDCQLIVQSNFKDRPDKEVIINGPYKPHEFHSKVASILEEKRWKRKVKEDTSQYEQFNVLGEKMAAKIHKFIEYSKNSSFMSQDNKSTSRWNYSIGDVYIRIKRSNIGELDHIEKVDEIIQDVKWGAQNRQTMKDDQESRQTLQQPRPMKEDTYDGFGVHFFPPIIIDQKQKRNIIELLDDSPNHLNSCKMFDMKIGNNQIIANKDGFIFVENKSKEDALKILNLIMAYGRFYGLSLYAVREHELVKANYNKQELTITNRQWGSETRRAYLIDNHSNKTQHGNPITRTEVKLNIIQEILSNIEKLLENKKLTENMILLNEGLTHFQNSEFIPSFIMGWKVIENHYRNLWEISSSQKNIKQKDTSKQNKSHQSIDTILKKLDRQGKINKDSFDLLMNLKEKRNESLHDDEQVTKEDIGKCLRYATKILFDKLKIFV